MEKINKSFLDINDKTVKVKPTVLNEIYELNAIEVDEVSKEKESFNSSFLKGAMSEEQTSALLQLKIDELEMKIDELKYELGSYKRMYQEAKERIIYYEKMEKRWKLKDEKNTKSDS